MDDAEFAAIDDEFRRMDRVQLEAIVTGAPVGISLDQVSKIVHAKAELVRRDREYAEEQERSRRKFETDRDTDRENHDIRMFDQAGLREIARQKFEENLAQRQMDHAATLAKEQLDTARAAARAARWAALAAGISALGAIGQLVVAIVGSLLAQP